VRIAESSGLNRHALDDTIIVPWNDLAALERALDMHRGQVAAVVTEGVMANMGVIPPGPGYLNGVQQLAHDHGALFVLDETVTGFRVAPGGCQELYGLSPDVSTFGKALGAGLPVAAIGGRADVMDAFRWGGVLHYGTQNASRVGLAAARASLRILGAEGGAAFVRLRHLADRLVSGLRAVIAETRTPAVVQHVGPMLQVFFTGRPAIRDYREFCAHVDRARFQRVARALFRHGVYVSPSAALHSVVSLAHTDAHVDATVDAVREVLIVMRGEAWPPLAY
jgi:glutamate-1-semialdehyde 2,1-aminomutase